MPKFIMESMEGVDDAIAGLYSETENNGKKVFVLTGIDGAVSKTKVDEFRTNNINLKNKLDAYKDVTPDKITEITSELEEAKIKLENAGKVDEEVVSKLVEKRVGTITTEFKEKEGKYVESVNNLNLKLENLIIDGEVNKAAAEHKVHSSALTDVILRSKATFKLVDSVPKAFDSDGEKMYGPDGVSDLNIGDWVKGLIKTSPHLFESSVTGGIKDGKRIPTGDVSKMSPINKIMAGIQ